MCGELGTHHLNKAMPKLNVPMLEEACHKYLQVQKPLLSERQFKKTSVIVKDFISKEGKGTFI